MTNVIFKPAIGSRYDEQTTKVLILGESHYNKHGDELNENYTKDVLRCHLDRVKGRRHRFFTTIAKVLTGKLETYLDDEAAKAFWETVVFYNYVQGFVGDKSRVRPTEEMFRSSKDALEMVFEELEPSIVIVLGKQLGGWLDHLEVDFKGAKVCYWYHPSAFGHFKKWVAWETYNKVIEDRSDLRC